MQLWRCDGCGMDIDPSEGEERSVIHVVHTWDGDDDDPNPQDGFSLDVCEGCRADDLDAVEAAVVAELSGEAAAAGD